MALDYMPRLCKFYSFLLRTCWSVTTAIIQFDRVFIYGSFWHLKEWSTINCNLPNDRVLEYLQWQFIKSLNWHCILFTIIKKRSDMFFFFSFFCWLEGKKHIFKLLIKGICHKRYFRFDFKEIYELKK